MNETAGTAPHRLVALGLLVFLILPVPSCNNTESPTGTEESRTIVDTLDVSLACMPVEEMLPFGAQICVVVRNIVDSPRTYAGRVDLKVSSGTNFEAWRVREIPLAPDGIYENCWIQELPRFHSLAGHNIAHLFVTDITPPPYNQPPYPPSGATATDICTVQGNIPVD